MKRAALAVFASAALLAAQNVQDPKPNPRAELAEIIAVEQQEGDLAKAEKMYRSKIDSLGLSAEGRAYANLRLGSLLARLGRDDEAKPFLDRAAKANLFAIELAKAPQDVEREAKLREQARALILRVVKQRGKHWGPPLHGIDNTGVANQLLWLGAAAVPEVIAELQQQVVTVSTAGPVSYVTGLAGFLWHNGGDAAAEYLESCTKVENVQFREAVAKSAFQARSERMLQVATRFLNDQDDGGNVVRALMQSSSRKGPSLQDTLDPDVFVEAVLQGPPAALKFSFTWGLKQRKVSPELLSQWHARVRQALKSTDPELGTAANEFLLSGTSQGSVEGIELLLHELPKMQPTQLPQQVPKQGGDFELSRENAVRLLPAVDACARAVGKVDQQDQRRQWLVSMMWYVVNGHGPGCEAEMLAWIDLGHEVLWRLFEGRIDDDNAAEVVGRVGGGGEAIEFALLALGRVEKLPVEVFPLLRERAEALRGQYAGLNEFAMPMARTGNEAAADWILAEWRRSNDGQNWAAGPLVVLGRHVRTEPVRAALREIAPAAARSRSVTPILALLAMGDESALDLVVTTDLLRGSSWHPYASAPVDERPSLRPLDYLLYEVVDPPNPYTDAQVHDVLRRIFAGGARQPLAPQYFSMGAIPDRHLRVIADLAIRAKNGTDTTKAWVEAYLARMRDESVPAERRNAITDWCRGILRGSDAALRWQLLWNHIGSEDVGLTDALTTLVDSDDGRTAELAVDQLRRRGVVKGEEWLRRLAGHRFMRLRAGALSIAREMGVAAQDAILPMLGDVGANNRRMAAEFMGEIVSKETVPQLIALLRDPSEAVRTAAADSLTRIRFYHEQQAHWDRVLKGLDASPASAAEKLLLQARPGAPREQRILAIKSLGVLGRPEALPFLIEWTTDPDQEIAVQANTAITQIHLGAKK